MKNIPCVSEVSSVTNPVRKKWKIDRSKHREWTILLNIMINQLPYLLVTILNLLHSLSQQCLAWVCKMSDTTIILKCMLFHGSCVTYCCHMYLWRSHLLWMLHQHQLHPWIIDLFVINLLCKSNELFPHPFITVCHYYCLLVLGALLLHVADWTLDTGRLILGDK